MYLLARNVHHGLNNRVLLGSGHPDKIPCAYFGIEMKNLILVLFAAVVLPHYQPMFDGMIARCDNEGKCHWECEFGVATSTTMVNDNLVVKPSGCNASTKPPENGVIQINPRTLQLDTTVYHSSW